MTSHATTVIIGQGYVGLPLAQAAVDAGLAVIGLDMNEDIVSQLNSGVSHIDDLRDSEVAAMVERGYRASSDSSVIADASTVVICVPTPLSESGEPDLRAVRGASESIAEHLRPGTLVVLESTTYPGTTDDLVRPILECRGLVAGVDFHLAFSPERIDPGNAVYGIRNTPKVVGGINAGSTEAARTFYLNFVDTVVPTKGTREAETAKLLENTYRHINIALVNEMARFCHELDIDIWDVINAAATKPFGFQAFYPGPGVGGHCIPIDPNYLSFEVQRKLGHPFRFVELAEEINNSMPKYIVSRVQDALNDKERSLRGSRVLLLGVTYKANISDQRESPSRPIAELLLAKGATVEYHDPHVHTWALDNGTTLSVSSDELEAARNADIVVLLQNHSQYDLGALVEASSVFFDSRGVTKGPKVVRL
ncbi:MAG: nucleotide sugar dehydrogenase [Actinobacteria bacterium]|nr:nucleotide sugar dehydrogenase [Actinomycetota bacterium]MBU1609341.1 nucleotide sugar dehydrogenase [Actinomycetota bacterium]MBU2314973.1 nucleotide sugar dehydrogenase [Actinomycetota bacterium]MBU2385061.1 nucleotide sugar dehydrogenase [Actinomycetota bacterium]